MDMKRENDFESIVNPQINHMRWLSSNKVIIEWKKTENFTSHIVFFSSDTPQIFHILISTGLWRYFDTGS